MSSDDPRFEELIARVESLEGTLAQLEKRISVLEPPAPATVPSVRAEVAAPPPEVEKPAEKPATPPPLPKVEVVRPSVPPVTPPPPELPKILPVPPSPRVTAPQEPTPFERMLEALHLRPPSGEGSGEVQLGAWWATRIGALLVLLAVVFFGAYVSIATPPWVKLAELAAVSVGVALFGRWLDSRVPRFGAVLFGTGLAMVYFTAFAAYAIPPVKITDSIVVAAALQAGAVALIFVVALRRDSPTVATMATLCGFLSAFFSIAEGFDDFAVIGALAMAVVTVLLRRSRAWSVPLVCAVVLTHAIVIAVSTAIWNTETGARSAPIVFGIVAAAFLVIFASVVLEGTDEHGRFTRVQRWVQSLNGSLGAVAGLIAATTVMPGGELSMYFFSAGAVLTLAAVWAWRAAPEDPLMSAFAVKASALVTLGVMTEWGTRTRWTALLVEAFVLLAAAKRTRKTALIVTAVAAWVVSLVYFFSDVGQLQGLLLSPGGAAVAIYVLASPILFALVLQMTAAKTGEVATGSAVLLGAVSAAPAWEASGLVFDESWGPLAMIGAAAGLVAAARALRSVVPVIAAGVAFAWAHAAVHAYSVFEHGSSWLWSSVLLVAGLTAAAAWWSVEVRAEKDIERYETWRVFGAALAVLAMAAVFAGGYMTWPLRVTLGGAIVASTALAWSGVLTRRDAWLAAGVVSAVAAQLLAVFHQDRAIEVRGPVSWLWVAALAGVVLLAAMRRPVDPDFVGAPRWRGMVSWLAALNSIALIWWAADAQFGIVGSSWTAVVAALVLAVMAAQLRIGQAFGAASILLAGTMLAVSTAASWPTALAPWNSLVSAWCVGVGFVVLPAVAMSRCVWIPREFGTAWRVVHVIVGAIFILHAALQRPAAWASLTTVVWALAGIAFFIVGLFFRARSHRVGGLLVLALCIPRVFMVDINSTFYRIAAFVVLGIVLLAVGFSYQQFRRFVDADEPEKGKPAVPEA